MPPLTEEEYQQLEQNILSRNKCHDAILLWRQAGQPPSSGIIVDGFNRFCICVTHGIEFEVKEVDFASRDDAKIWIIENQLGRRNLNAAQRIELALSKADVLREKARDNQSRAGRDKSRADELFTKTDKVADESINVEKAIAQEADVGQGTLQRYMQIKNSGNPQLLEQLQNGEIKIGTAHRMLLPEIKKQLRQADKIYAYIKERLPLDNEENNRRICEQLNRLAEQIRGFLA